mgnify:FL=1
MYKIVLSIFLVLSIFVNAQEVYSNIDSIVIKSINRYPKNSKNYIIGNTILSNFKKAKNVETDLVSKINVGICVGLNISEMNDTVYPARFYGTKKGLDISALRDFFSGGLTDDMKEYVYDYLYKLSDVGSTKTFKYLISDEPKKLNTAFSNANEHVLKQEYTISFIRADKDWVYVISVSENYKKLKYPDIITYAFKVNPSGADIFKTQGTKNSVEEKRSADFQKNLIAKEKFLFAHEQDSYVIKLVVKNLLEHDPYKTDKKLIKINKRLENTEIKNFNLGDFENDFKYLSKLKLSEDFLNKNFSDKDGYNFMYSLNHYANHNLGDYYLSINNNALAVQSFNAALNQIFTYSSGRSDIEDIIKANENLSLAYQKLNNIDVSLSCLLANVLMDDGVDEKAYAKQFKAMLEKNNQNKSIYKAKINDALKTVIKINNFDYAFDFKGLKVKFYLRNPRSIETIKDQFMDSVFYKSFD